MTVKLFQYKTLQCKDIILLNYIITYFNQKTSIIVTFRNLTSPLEFAEYQWVIFKMTL